MSGQRKIKVLRIINRFNIGGPTFNATFLSRFLSDDFETLLVGGLPEEDESDSLHILDEYGIKPILIPEMKRTPNFKSDRAAYKRIKQIIEEFQPDIVHTHAAKAGALGRRAAFACKVPIVVHTFHGHVFHSYFGKIKTSIYKLIEKRLAKKSTGIIAISEIQKNELSKVHRIVKNDKVKVIPLGFDLSKFRRTNDEDRQLTRLKLELSEETIAIAIVGRLAAIKDHSFFLDVAERVLTLTAKKVHFFIVGDGSEREAIEKRVNSINEHHDSVITMTSWIIDIATFNKGMDIMCLTSKNEGTPVSLIEAQASGIPLVTTDVGGVRDVVKDGETGFIVPLDRIDLFVDKMLILIEDEKKRKIMSQNGWSFVEQKFHYERLVRDMENYYWDLLNTTKK